jgi:hypothetical protein
MVSKARFHIDDIRDNGQSRGTAINLGGRNHTINQLIQKLALSWSPCGWNISTPKYAGKLGNVIKAQLLAGSHCFVRLGIGNWSLV